MRNKAGWRASTCRYWRKAIMLSVALAVSVVPVWAQYDNGPPNGTTDAWTINFGYSVSDTFYWYNNVVAGFDFYAWIFPGDVLLTVDWTITGLESARPKTYGQGTAAVTQTLISTNQYGYDVAKETVAGLNAQLHSGYYWLTLQNAVVSTGDPVYWDENSGIGCHSNGCPSRATESAIGTIPSESFDILGRTCCEADPGTVPEPASILLLGPVVVWALAQFHTRRRN